MFDDDAAPLEPRPAFVDPRLVIRSRTAIADRVMLDALNAQGSLVLNLFDDRIYGAALDRVVARGSDRFVWVGHLEGEGDSSVVLVVSGDQITGSVTGEGGVFAIRPLGGGRHVILEMNGLVPSTGGAPLELPATGSSEAVPGPQADLLPRADSPNQIDVMIVYTAAAKAQAGGTTQIADLAELAVQETNQAYANSLITQRLVLVHTAEVGYSEFGDSKVDLARLRNPSDGYMDIVHELRDRYRADVVSLFMSQLEPGIGGRGNLMGPEWLSVSFAPYAFSVVDVDFATAPGWAFAHELGHNMGAEHETSAAEFTPAFAWSYGYVDPLHFRTIMAYGGLCALTTCPIVFHFSNPAVTHDGRPTGVWESPNLTNNAGTLNATAEIVANFRVRVNPYLSISPSTGTTSQYFSGSATGYAPEQTALVETFFPGASTPARTSTKQVSGSGSFSFAWYWSAGEPCGTYRIRGTDVVTGKFDDVYFSISGCSTLPPVVVDPHVSVSPPSGPPGTVWSQPGWGFTPNSTATLYFINPSGNPALPNPVQATDANGAYSLTYSSVTQAVGVWHYYAVDNTTGKQSNTVSFTVTDPGTPPPTVDPQISSSPVNGAYDDPFRITGTGFTPFGAVDLTLHSETGGTDYAFDLTANSGGGFQFTWRTSTGDDYGDYHVRAEDVASGQSDLISIHVARPPAPPGPERAVSVSPLEGPKGTVFTFRGINYEPGADIEIRLQRVGDTQSTRSCLDCVDASGNFVWVWTTDSSTGTGWWDFNFRERYRSATARSVSLMVLGPPEGTITVTNDVWTVDNGSWGDPFTATIGGLATYTTYQIQLVDPIGRVFPKGQFSSGSTGTYVYHFTFVEGDLTGYWHVQVTQGGTLMAEDELTLFSLQARYARLYAWPLNQDGVYQAGLTPELGATFFYYLQFDGGPCSLEMPFSPSDELMAQCMAVISTGAVVKVELPPGIEYLGFEGDGTFDPATGIWLPGDAGINGLEKSCALRVRALTSGEHVFYSELTHLDQTMWASVPGNHSTTEYDDDVEVVTVPYVADLSLAIWVNPLRPEPGASIDVTVSVYNNGPDPANGVQVTAALPQGLSYVSDDSGGAYTPATGVWLAGTVAADQAATLTIRARAEQLGAVSGVAEVSAADERDPDSTPGNGDATEDDYALLAAIVVDLTAPTVGTHAPLTAEATGPSGAVVTYSNPTATDAGGPASPTVACIPASGSTFPLGATTVTCSATDDAGNTGTSTFTVTVRDTTAPTVGMRAPVTVEATGPSGAAVTYTSPTASDLVAPLNPAVTCTPASGATFALGATTVTCAATDTAGNRGTSTFVVTVRDTTAPTLSLPANMTVEATGPSGRVVSYAATASDLVAPLSPTISCVPVSGSTFSLGTTTVNCSATDTAGNTRAGSFTVTVRDTTGPTVSVHAPVVVEATGPSGAVATYAKPTATDLVAPASPTVSCGPASGSMFPLGDTTVTCSATDAAGNTGTSTFTITVRDTTAPSVTPPANVTAQATSPAGVVVSYPAATATDLVGVTSGPACLPASGSLFPAGTTTVTCSASDAAGNLGTATFTVTVDPLSEVTFRSTATFDGWVLESGEDTDKGGTFDTTATTARVGDDALDRQYRAILDFDTSELPDSAVITGVTLRIKRESVTGWNPILTHGLLKVDVKTGFWHENQLLERFDFQAVGGRGNVGRFIKAAVDRWHRAPLRSPSYQWINLTGTTQFRLRFDLDDNDDGGADYLSFYTGDAVNEADRPELIVTYYVP